MTITFSSDSSVDRRELPAWRDRGRDLPLRDNPFNAPASNTGASSPDDEGLIGLYPYSGADIKLVVHLPPEDPRVANQETRRLQEELESLITRLNNALDAEGQVSQSEARLTELRELETYYLEQANQAPEGSSLRTTAEGAVNETRRDITELEALLTQARNHGNAEELEQQAYEVRLQLEARTDQDPSGPSAHTKVLGEIQTLSISDYREKYPVRTLGSVYPRSITRGPRTISGSLVFTTFNQHVMSEFLEVSQYRNTGVGDWDRFRYTSYLMDQIPPLDISISFANEYGNLSWMAILGVEFVNEGQVMSIEDLFMEGTAQWIARDFDPIRSVANRRLSRTHGVGQALSGTSIMIEDLRRRQSHRNIPWI